MIFEEDLQWFKNTEKVIVFLLAWTFAYMRWESFMAYEKMYIDQETGETGVVILDFWWILWEHRGISRGKIMSRVFTSLSSS